MEHTKTIRICDLCSAETRRTEFALKGASWQFYYKDKRVEDLCPSCLGEWVQQLLDANSIKHSSQPQRPPIWNNGYQNLNNGGPDV
jgi:hypothetical protein